MNNQLITLTEVLDALKQGKLEGDSEIFNIYGDVTKSAPTLNDVVYIGEPNEVPDDIDDEDYDEALIPESAKEKGWELLYSGDLVEDVLQNIKHQLNEFDNSLLLKAIEYYMKYDCFYDFKDQGFNAAEL